MASKTRDKLIDVARQLFASNGVERTTINDIAEASDKGRRTVYTYFKNKREIYNAVIERESDMLLQDLRNVVRTSMPPAQKLELYLRVRFDFLSELSPKHSYIRKFFIHDFKRVERIRRLALDKEASLFASVIDDGVLSGDFDSGQARRLQAVEAILFQGIDMAHARNRFSEAGMSVPYIRDQIITFIINAVCGAGSSGSAQLNQSNHNETT